MAYKAPEPDKSAKRLNLTRKMVDFGTIKTNGAFRLLGERQMLIPLPESKSFDVLLDLGALLLPGKINRVESLNEQLKKQKEVPFTLHNGLLKFTTAPGVFAYRFVE